jgi:toxin ParE1/3/4
MRLEQSRLAKADIDAIFEFGLANHGIDGTLHYLDAIEHRFKQLLSYPLSGRAEPEISGSLRSMSCEAHRIYYEIVGDAIIIQRVLHKSAEVRRWLE